MEKVADRERLVAALRARGVDWLAPGDALGEPVDDEQLIGSLAAHEDARLRAALTGLFILRPALAATVRAVADLLDGEARSELMARYMAAVYLQHLWRTRLGLYLGQFDYLTDLFSEELGLPGAGEGFGKVGLQALADWHGSLSKTLYNRLSEYGQKSLKQNPKKFAENFRALEALWREQRGGLS